jgi:hypothetical protein
VILPQLTSGLFLSIVQIAEMDVHLIGKLREHLKKIILLAFFSVSFVLYALPAQLQPTDFLQDDSYFYLQVALNILRGEGSTFHQITSTNGYHPLWMLFAILGLGIAGTNKFLGLHIIFALQTIIFLGTAFAYYKIARLVADDFWVAGLAILAAFFFGMGVYGSEAHLNALMLTMTIYYFLAALLKDDPIHWVMIGIFSGLSVLARLDNIFVIGILYLYGVMNGQGPRLKDRIKYSLRLSIPFAFVVSPYLLYNYLSFGHLVPISGMIKSTFPELSANIHNLGRFGKISSVFALFSVVYSFDPYLTHLRKIILRVLGIGALLHASYVVLFTDHYTFWPWYYVSGVLNLAFLFDFTVDRVASILTKYMGHNFNPLIKNLAIVVLATGGIARGWLKAYDFDSIGPLQIPKINQYRWPDEVALWMSENIPNGSGVFVQDWPGAISYYSNLRILPMDGLMNDFKYNQDLVSLGIEEYLCSKNIHYFLGPDQPNADEFQEIEVFAPLYRRPVGKLRLYERDLLVRIRDVVNSPEETPPIAIWRIDTCGDSAWETLK